MYMYMYVIVRNPSEGETKLVPVKKRDLTHHHHHLPLPPQMRHCHLCFSYKRGILLPLWIHRIENMSFFSFVPHHPHTSSYLKDSSFSLQKQPSRNRNPDFQIPSSPIRRPVSIPISICDTENSRLIGALYFWFGISPLPFAFDRNFLVVNGERITGLLEWRIRRRTAVHSTLLRNCALDSVFATWVIDGHATWDRQIVASDVNKADIG